MLVEKELCCGCGVCASVCNVGACKMQLDQEGFMYPIVDNEKCIECGICEKHCPIITAKGLKLIDYNTTSYCGSIKDISKLKASASGGAATAIAEKIIQFGGIVYGVSYINHYRYASHIRVDSLEDINKLQGTKYIQSRKDNIYINLKKDLLNKKTVLYFGTPCEIAAVKSYLKDDFTNLLTCELICHGPTSEKVIDEYLNILEKKYNSQVNNLNIRFNKKIWTKPYLRAQFSNGQEYIKPFYLTEYGLAFTIVSRPSCYNCTFKGSNKVADITIGDFWGAKTKSDYWNNEGVSVILTHTEKGNKLVNSLDNFKLSPASSRMIVEGNPMLVKSLPLNSERKRFMHLLEENGLDYACRKQRGFKYKTKRLVKKLLPKKLFVKMHNHYISMKQTKK